MFVVEMKAKLEKLKKQKVKAETTLQGLESEKSKRWAKEQVNRITNIDTDCFSVNVGFCFKVGIYMAGSYLMKPRIINALVSPYLFPS